MIILGVLIGILSLIIFTFRPKHLNKSILLISSLLLVVLTLAGCSGGSQQADHKQYEQASQRVFKAKRESKKLAITASKQAAESSSVAKISSSVAKEVNVSSETKAKKTAESSKASSASAASVATAKKQSSEVASKSEAESKTAASQATQQSEAQSSSSVGKTDTGETGDIIGNARSKIYHTPGQAGYHINDGNAVHFKSEAEAQAAGYRRAKR